MQTIGTKIYYCLNTGEILNIIGDMFGDVRETTFEEDITNHDNLKCRNSNSIGVIYFPYGEYSKISKNKQCVKINLTTLEPEFIDVVIEKELSLREKLQNKIKLLEDENLKLKEELIKIKSN